MKVKRMRISAFTLMEIMIVCAIIGLLGAIAVPTFIRSRTTAQTGACLNNLRQLVGAKEEWALEHLKDYTDVPADSDLFGASLYISEKPFCPADGTYTLNSIGANPTCTVNGHTLP